MPVKLTTEEWVKKAKRVHGDQYDYSKSVYLGKSHKIEIICPLHGSVWQDPRNHINNNAKCIKCAGTYKYNTKEWIELAKSVHGDMYDYSEVDYKNATTPVSIICKNHGIFTQIPRDHRDGHGCNKCAIEIRTSQGRGDRKTTNEFIEAAKKVHGDFYDYSNTEYITSRKSVTVLCPQHGKFQQRASAHLSGSGCKKCAARQSKKEKELIDFLESLNLDTQILKNDRNLISPYELDLYIPEHHIAIEFCGIYWHSDAHDRIDKNYHRNKYLMCADNNVQLITIFEDEWDDRKIQVKQKLKSLLKCDDRNRVYARNCKVVEVSKQDKSKFFNDNHIQSSGDGGIVYGLLYKDELVACMAFKKKQEGEYYLNRYATSCHVIGGSSKLVKHFSRNNEWQKLVSFADLRWSDGKLYETTGWELDSELRPDYYYLYRGERKHKFNFRLNALKKILGNSFDPSKTEAENTRDNNIYRIWDCGKLRYVLHNV